MARDTEQLLSVIIPAFLDQVAAHFGATIAAMPAASSRGLPSQPSWVQSQDQELRNHKVGSTRIVAVSGPRLATVRRIGTSSGDALAYLGEDVEVTNVEIRSLQNGCFSFRPTGWF